MSHDLDKEDVEIKPVSIYYVVGLRNEQSMQSALTILKETLVYSFREYEVSHLGITVYLNNKCICIRKYSQFTSDTCGDVLKLLNVETLQENVANGTEMTVHPLLHSFQTAFRDISGENVESDIPKRIWIISDDWKPEINQEDHEQLKIFSKQLKHQSNRIQYWAVSHEDMVEKEIDMVSYSPILSKPFVKNVHNIDLTDKVTSQVETIVEEEFRESKYINSNSRSGIVFLVDSKAKMFETIEDLDSAALEPVTYFELASHLIQKTMKTLIRNGGKNYSSVIFFDSREVENSKNHRGVYVFQQLEQVGAQHILNVSNLSVDNFESSIGSERVESFNSSTPMENAFRIAHESLVNANLGYGDRKSIWLLTNDDNPFKGDNRLKERIVTCFNDFRGPFKAIALWPLEKDTTFDITKEYQELIPEQNEIIWGGNKKELDDQIDYVYQRDFVKRRLSSVYFKIGGTKFAVSIFTPFMSAKKPETKSVTSTGDSVKIENRLTYEVDGREFVVTPDDIQYYLTLGCKDTSDDRAYIKKKEYQQLKYSSDSGIDLIGFRSIAKLKQYNYRHSYMIRPDEGRTKGATKAFLALIQGCAKKNKVAVANVTCRRGQAARMAYLWPQLEKLDEEGIVTQPACFFIHFLPWANEIRDIDSVIQSVSNSSSVDEDGIDAAIKVVKSLQLQDGFQVNQYTNPKIQKIWRFIESKALHETMNWSDEDDTLLPNNELFESDRLKPILNEFCNSYGGNDEVTVKAKRKKPTNTVPVDWDNITPEEVKKLTVPQLKEKLKSMKIAVSGKKADLVDRILEHMNQS